jgi:hypothetical protein
VIRSRERAHSVRSRKSSLFDAVQRFAIAQTRCICHDPNDLKTVYVYTPRYGDPKLETGLPGRASLLRESNTAGCRRVSCHGNILKNLKLKTQFLSLTLRLEDASIDNSIGTVVVELRVCCLQGRFWAVADNLLAPDKPQPIRAPQARRSVTSLPSGHSLAPKFSRPIRALRLFEEGTIGVSEREEVRSLNIP